MEPRVVPGVHNFRGEIRQCNEGKFDFNLDDQSMPGFIIFELGVPKYLETGELDVDVNPLYVRCVVKEKVTQLKLPQEVSPDASKVQRSKTTGSLRIEMPVADPRPMRQNKGQPQPELKPLQPEQDPKARRKQPNGSVSVEGIYKDPRRVAKEKPKELLREVATKRIDTGLVDDDDDEIPPLEPVRVR